MMCGICKGTLFAYDEAAKVAYIGSKIELYENFENNSGISH